jgi:pimeloyl-ACP methyl ester carboxylesterase
LGPRRPAAGSSALPTSTSISRSGDWLPQLLAEHDASASSDPAAYSRLTMPVLLIWGEQDTTTPLSLGQYLARIIPGSRLVPMPGIGHMPPIEDAEAFKRILFEFLTLGPRRLTPTFGKTRSPGRCADTGAAGFESAAVGFVG